MKQIRHIFCVVIFLIGMIFLLGTGNVAQAKKYYTLNEIGLSDCTQDDIDYCILSIRGNVIRYEVYQQSKTTCEWERIGDVKTAKMTSKTKCYVGDAEQVSSSLKKDTKQTKKIVANNMNKRHLIKKSKNIDTEKWIFRIQKRAVKKYFSLIL